MSDRHQIIWIDDNPDRQATADDLGAVFLSVREKDLGSTVEELLNGAPPRLLVIDHVLDKAAGPDRLLLKKGSTIAEAVKEYWPYCPVVGVTNANNVDGIDVRTKGIYDALFPFSEFGRYLGRISGIATGFETIGATGADPERLIGLLSPPADESTRLHSALDSDLKNVNDQSAASRMHRWVNTLLDRPGFLLDRLWTATLLGLNEAGFDLVSDRFGEAIYWGIFERPDEPRWWPSQLTASLYRQCGANVGELTWHVGRRLPDVTDEHFSVCYYCKQAYPEIVAYLDEASDQQYAMHLRCTLLHPRYRRELYFEDVRIMRGE